MTGPRIYDLGPLADVATGDGLGKPFSIAGYLEFQRFPAFSIFHFLGVMQRHWQPATWRPLIKSSSALSMVSFS